MALLFTPYTTPEHDTVKLVDVLKGAGYNPNRVASGPGGGRFASGGGGGAPSAPAKGGGGKVTRGQKAYQKVDHMAAMHRNMLDAFKGSPEYQDKIPPEVAAQAKKLDNNIMSSMRTMTKGFDSDDTAAMVKGMRKVRAASAKARAFVREHSGLLSAESKSTMKKVTGKYSNRV